MTQFWLYFCK